MASIEDWKSRGKYFEFRGHRIFFRREENDHRVLLCLHGFPTSSYDYHKIWPELSVHSSPVSFDLIGYGFSDKPRNFSYTTFDQADILESLISELGIKHLDILAHDYGNTITQEILARSFECDPGFEIGKICFLNGALFPETHRPILAQKILISPIGAIFGRLIPERKFRHSLASVFGPDTKPTEGELEDFVKLFNHNGGRRISHKLIRYMRERAQNRSRWVGALEKMTQPFRFINGLADPVSGAHLVTRFRVLFPNQTDIIELPGIGHFPHFEKPDVVARHVRDFLTS
ncbi:MAG: alpha/beta hydrolase [Acidobacteriota bacterium]|nr:alpha/beta hydrolase [Acidobacteriota bacterium]